MTGLPTSMALELEDGSGNFTNDITGYMRNRAYTLKRGWSDENDEDNVQPAELQFDLDNKSGEFTLGAANFNGITKDKRVRLSVTVGGTTYRRCVGYAVDWPTKWESALANMAIASLTAVDRLARLNRRKLRSITEHEILLDAPAAYYTLGEAVGSTSAGDTSGNAHLPLGIVGAGSAPVFGASGPSALDELTACTFAGGQYLRSSEQLTLTSFTIECCVRRVSLPSAPEAFLSIPAATLNLSATGLVRVNTLDITTAAISSATSIADASWHHVALTVDASGGGTWTLYVDGVSVGTASPGVLPGGLLSVGGSEYLGTELNWLGLLRLSGDVSGVALYNSTLSAARVAAHANAVLNGFATDRADQRIARLASYANIPTADQNLETGMQPSIAAQSTNGASVLDAMRDVAQAEDGGLFIAGDNKLTLHNKDHRVLKATGAPQATFTADQVDWRDAEFEALNYLFNTATGTRNGGAQQRSVNATSVGKYEEWSTDESASLIPTDELLLNKLTWVTTMYGEPLARLASFTLDLLTLPQATVQAALALELGDHIRITGFPSQAPSSSIDLILEGFTETASQTESQTVWKITFNTAPAQLFYAWILGDATYGVLGSTTRLYH